MVPSSATPLTPLQLNGIHFDIKHTVLTPAMLDSLADATCKPTGQTD